MKLYHYSAEPHKTLKTIQKQKRNTPEDVEKAEAAYRRHKKLFGVFPPGYYYEHISFFFDPIHRDITKYFPKGHEFWYPRHTIYEHIVDLSERDNFDYEVVEFPERIELYYDKSVDDATFFRKVGKMLKNDHYIGTGYQQLKSLVERKELAGKTDEYFARLLNRPNYEDIRMKYAATVPHVMIYPFLGTLTPVEVNKLTLE